jgi:outer membrane protein assembly factor BamB
MFLTLCATIASGQQPKRPKDPIPVPLLPAEQAWIVTLPALPSAGGALDDQRAYVPTADGQLIALQRQTGELAWSQAVATDWAPALADDTLYVSSDSAVLALDAATGETRWSLPFIGTPLAAPAVAGDLLAVLIGQEDGAGYEIWAVRRADGQRLWQRALTDVRLPATIVGRPDALFVSLADRVLRLAVAGGAIQWTRVLPVTLTRPALADDRVIVGSSANGFYALDADSGSIEWKWTVGGDGSGAAALGNVVFLTSLDNMVKAVNRGNGHQRWRQETGTRPILPPIATGGIVVVVGLSPTLATFNAKTGAPISSYDAPAPLQGPPLMDAVLRPFRVAAVLVLRNGSVVGLTAIGLQFRDPPLLPLTVLPGRPVIREQPPAAARPR